MTPSSAAARRPTVDEWGVYDPQQAGLAALFTRLTTPSGPRPESADDSSQPGDASIKPAKG
ncbi:MAG TPA: hypothetical protein VL263_25285 [Vicinamibacterales bacterium]|nr:hypothetical protein [Vicinamibacterales bacterium]